MAQQPKRFVEPTEHTRLVSDPFGTSEHDDRSELYHARSPLCRAPSWQFWRTTSSPHRFYLLILMSCIPFGEHFVKNGMSSLEQLMLDDKEFPISNTMYGALLSAVSVPSMFLPLVGGRLMDKSGYHSIRFFLAWICVGQAIFALGMQLRLYWLALFGRVFFGVGAGSVVVGARVFIASWFRNTELTFAMGVSVAITNISKMLAKATVAPIALYFGGYVQALWCGVAVCVASTFVGVLVCHYTQKLKCIVKCRVISEEALDPNLHWLTDYVDKKRQKRRCPKVITQTKQMSYENVQNFSRMFWVIALLHVNFINVFHLFQNVSASFLYQRYHYSIVKAGIVSSLSHLFVVFAPCIGLAIDHFGGRIVLIIIAAILSVLAYIMMIFTETTPIVSMCLISICLSFTPMVLMAAIPSSVSRKNFGTAFGIVEITDAIGATFGNLIVGYLRDETGDYCSVMRMLLCLAISVLFLALMLVFEDSRHGWVLSVPNKRSRALTIGDEDSMNSRAALDARMRTKKETDALCSVQSNV
ncbi:major facilitator superfamily [Plasmopara halstedii]|uniref:Lysosomal dipeptide transporter MFSD1 n=1 Tax=Plasmopara halstedii TaxID=4781 RepID=A0A0P1ASP7_PLAHL|nr:major facilitator superfamily [Plasmopara halstedii]CEG44665.1 major facilitator superfamily [Plasmopara halstedii]|eukprot:XP_024581034.1 major facilitator superfamily [Plasmopara halstedii]